MTKDKIVQLVSKKLAGEFISFMDIEHLFDEVIDEINESLNSTYPTWDSVEGRAEYSELPDKYIRSVIVFGIAYKYYVEDEEGEQVATDYFGNYLDNTAKMVRDFVEHVPEEYRATLSGFKTDSRLESENLGGVSLYDTDYGL